MTKGNALKTILENETTQTVHDSVTRTGNSDTPERGPLESVVATLLLLARTNGFVRLSRMVSPHSKKDRTKSCLFCW